MYCIPRVKLVFYKMWPISDIPSIKMFDRQRLMPFETATNMKDLIKALSMRIKAFTILLKVNVGGDMGCFLQRNALNIWNAMKDVLDSSCVTQHKAEEFLTYHQDSVFKIQHHHVRVSITPYCASLFVWFQLRYGRPERFL